MEKKELLTCAFCGHSYPPGTPPTQHAALTAHVEVCDKHPMAQWKRRALEAEAKVRAIETKVAALYFTIFGGKPGT
jgi:hypothetical protein